MTWALKNALTVEQNAIVVLFLGIDWIYRKCSKESNFNKLFGRHRYAFHNMRRPSHQLPRNLFRRSFNCFLRIIIPCILLPQVLSESTCVEMSSMSQEPVSKQLLIFSSLLPSFPVEGLPAAAAHDKEPGVGIPVPEKEERVSALAGDSSENGFIWERSAQVWEWQPQETTGGSLEWGKKPEVLCSASAAI